MAAAPPHNRDGHRPVAKAELIVQNGRLRGMRRTLENPTTFIGKSTACDIRLNVDGISPLHCLIVRTDSDWLLRDLESASGTLVNGKRISSWMLRHGDLIMVGPYQFQVQISREPPRPSAAADVKPRTEYSQKQELPESAAQRIQVAAVAAQQVALNEWELRLDQREATLEKQQAQLSAHLEEKRQRLIELHAQTQAARHTLVKDRKEHERRVEQVTLDLTRTERELLTQKQQAEAERKRLFKLRQGLFRRFRRHWDAQKRRLEERAADLAAGLQHLEQDHANLQQRKIELTKTCLRFNSEVELGRRKLQMEWERFHAEQTYVREYLETKMNDLLDRETQLAEAESLLRSERQRLKAQVGDLRFEAVGLENRIRNARQLLGEVQQEIQQAKGNLQEVKGDADRKAAFSLLADGSRYYPLALPLPAAWRLENWLVPRTPVRAGKSQCSTVSPFGSDQNFQDLSSEQKGGFLFPAALQELESYADQLADQRLVLVQQWSQVVQAEDHWYQERQSVGSQMISLLAELQTQAQVLLTRERDLTNALAEVQTRHQNLLQFREHLVGWQGRLRAQEIELATLKEGQETALALREETLQRQTNALTELSKRWAALRQQELEAWQAKQEACDRASQEYHALNQERHQLLRKLEEERRTLTTRTLALEQYRQECLARAADPAAAERRLGQLQRRWANEESKALRVSKRQCNQLQRELAQVRARNEELIHKLKRLSQENRDLHGEKTEWEKDRLRIDMACIEVNKNLQGALVQRDQLQQRLTDMRNEVEQLARQLIEEPPSATLPDPQRAVEMPVILPLDRAA